MSTMKRVLAGGIALLVLVVLAFLWTRNRVPRTSSAGEPPSLSPTSSRVLDAERAVAAPAVVEEGRRALAIDEGEVSSAPAPSARLLVQTVARDSGKPLAGVTVFANEAEPSTQSFEDLLRDMEEQTLTGNGEGLGLGKSTDENGRVEYRVPSGIALLLTAQGSEVEIGDAEEPIAPLEPGERRDVIVQLDVGGRHYFGRVIDRESHAPIAGATVQLRDWRVERSSHQVADESGVFELVGSERGDSENQTLTVEAEGYGPACAEFEAGHSSPDRAQVLRLSRAAAITARVLDGLGEPLTGIAVRLVAPLGALLQPAPSWGDFDRPDNPEWTGKTDAQGRCRLVGLPTRVTLRLEVPRTDDLPVEQRELALAPGEERALDIVLAGEITLHCRVVDQDDRPVADLDLWVDRTFDEDPGFFQDTMGVKPLARGKTDHDGRFEAQAPPGLWRIGPAPREYEMLSTATGSEYRLRPVPPESERCAACWTVVRLMPQPAVQEVVLHIQRGLYLRGKVVDPRGDPATGAIVRLRSGMHDDLQYCAADGSFIFGPLDVAECSLRAEANGFAPSEKQRAKPGGEDVLLRLLPSAGSIRGRLLLGPYSYTATVVLAVRRGDREIAGATLEADGAFHFDTLDAGVYDVLVRNDRGACGRAVGLSPATDGGAPVTIELEPAVTVRVVYLGEHEHADLWAYRDGAPLATAWVATGTSAVLRVMPGPLTIELSPSTGGWAPAAPVASRAVDVVSGDELEVVFP